MLKGILLLSVASSSLAHSWLACSDYRIDESKWTKSPPDLSEIMTWDGSRCQGFPRNAYTYATKNGFGNDLGYNYQPGTGSYCGHYTTRSSSNYNSDYPKATWKAGSRACLAWPPKNHVAGSNAYIKDAFTRIYLAPGANLTSDPSSASDWILVTDMGPSNYSSTFPGVAAGGYPRTGFQNCPNFNNDPGSALCINCIDVPSNLANGVYTLAWLWAFNSATDLYSNCFDVEIVGSSAIIPSISPSPSFGAAVTPTPTPTRSPASAAVTPGPSANPTQLSCTYTLSWMGGNGFGGTFVCTFPTVPSSWSVIVTWESGTTATEGWNSVLSANGNVNTFNNANYNGNSQVVTIGFNGKYSSSTQPVSVKISVSGSAAVEITVQEQDADGNLPDSASSTSDAETSHAYFGMAHYTVIVGSLLSIILL